MKRVRLGAGILAAACALAGCASRTLTTRGHGAAPDCAVREDGAAILCGDRVFATLECSRAGAGCSRLALRYADGDVAQLFAARDARYDSATRVATAPDGSRIWFLELEGGSAARRWHEYDVARGKLFDVADGLAQTAAANAGAVPLAVER